MVVEAAGGCFSVNYTNKRGEIESADWDGCARMWSRSVLNWGEGLVWDCDLVPTKLTWRQILKRFELARWIGEFPFRKVISMSPAELIASRRRKEKEGNLVQIFPHNDTLGDPGSPENYN